MKLIDLRPGMENIHLKVSILRLKPQKEVTTYSGFTHRIVEGMVEDDTEKMGLTVWNEKIDCIQEIKIGNKIELTNCFITSFKGVLSVNVGRESKIMSI
jgi:ssDNA-binding replication factor A large subunit